MNNVLHQLEAGDVAVGMWLLSRSPRVAEVVSRTAVDWLGIDTEHAPYSPESVETMVRAVDHGTTPLVRLPSVEATIAGGAKRALDAGAGGIIVPDVQTPTEARRVVRAARFPPAGERGVAGTVRANGYGENFDEYVATANEETIVVIQLESPGAIDRVDEILAVEGIDVAFVGENDLSSALGHPGNTDRPEVDEAIRCVSETADATGVYTGIASRTPETMTRRTNRGFQFFLLGADLTFVQRGVERYLAE